MTKELRSLEPRWSRHVHSIAGSARNPLLRRRRRRRLICSRAALPSVRTARGTFGPSWSARATGLGRLRRPRPGNHLGGILRTPPRRMLARSFVMGPPDLWGRGCVAACTISACSEKSSRSPVSRCYFGTDSIDRSADDAVIKRSPRRRVPYSTDTIDAVAVASKSATPVRPCTPIVYVFGPTV